MLLKGVIMPVGSVIQFTQGISVKLSVSYFSVSFSMLGLFHLF